MISLFGLGKGSGNDTIGPPVDIQWARNAKGRFHNLMFLDTAAENLQNVGGVFAIWHGGAKPMWLYVGSTPDLGQALEGKIDDPEIERFYDRVGVYVSWSLAKPEFHDGIVRYLTDTMMPEIDNPDAPRTADEKPIAVFLPGLEKKPSKKQTT